MTQIFPTNSRSVHSFILLLLLLRKLNPMAEVHPIGQESPHVMIITIDATSEEGANPNPDATRILEAVAEEEANPVDAWLPITESRNGSLWSCVFHLVSSGIGVQALLLPVAFASLGWAWGIISLTIAFIWQLYTIWVLVQLHQPAVHGTRYSRFLQLAIAAFGPKLGKILAIFPVMYLSGGSCVVFIITGSGAMELFFKEISSSSAALTGAEWYLVFIAMAILMAAQRPNLDSISGFSLVAAITGVTYCTMLWAIPVANGRVDDAGGLKMKVESGMGRVSEILNGIGIVMLSFRGHNLVLEIQGTLASGPKASSKKKMLRAVIISYAIVMACLFPLAIAGFWAYGNKVPSSGGLLKAFTNFHHPNTSKPLKAIIYFLILLNCLTSFQIYAMPVFDNLESRFVALKNKPCPKWVRVSTKLFFGGLTFLISVAFPFLPSLAPLVGGIALPLTFAYPCLMWIAMKKGKSAHRKDSLVWGFNLLVGGLGMGLSVLLVAGAIWNLATKGLRANFFRP